MQAPQRWSDIAVGLALGYTRGEIAAGLGESVQTVSASVKDMQSTLDGYDDPAELLGELFGAEIESGLDQAAVQQFREEKNQDNED